VFIVKLSTITVKIRIQSRFTIISFQFYVNFFIIFQLLRKILVCKRG